MLPSDEYLKKRKALLDEFHHYGESGTFSLNKSTSNLFRNRKENGSNKLDVRNFNQVISVDPTQLIAEVEGMTTYETLVHETLKYGCLPPVVPQLKTITIGGAIVGLGIESSSFRYGLVHETVLEIEVLTGEGKVVTARPDNEHSDLFFALPNSYGTLGYVLKVKIQLIVTKKYIRLTNLQFDAAGAFFEKLEELCTSNKNLSYIDGVIFSETEKYIILGEWSDEAPMISNYTYMQAYYQSIRKKSIQYLTVLDYIWRWDADWFWCSKHFGMNNSFLRFLFGKWMLHSSVYWKIKRLVATNRLFNWLVHRFEKPSESVIQDILIPIQNASFFYDFLRQTVRISPIWICPFQFYQKEKRYSLCLQLDPQILYLDFGFWDIVESTNPKGFFNRLIERESEALNGFKSLYSDSFYSEEEFWKIYPKSVYANLKERYDPKGVFKDLYQKCVKE